MSGLSADEIAFLKKVEERKQKHKEASQKYRDSNKDKIKEYNKSYNEEQKTKLNEIKSKHPKITIPTPINIQEITQEAPKIDRRTRRGKKQPTTEIKPFFETRKEPLEYSTIEDYIKNLSKNHYRKK